MSWLLDTISAPFRRAASKGRPPAPPPEDRYDLYRPEERRIFYYWNGSQMVSADPMVLYKKVAEKGVEIDHDWKASRVASKFATGCHSNLVKTVRDIFTLKTFEEGGLTEAEALDLLDFFLVYVETVKKNSKTPATGATGASPPTPSSPDAGPPTSNGSDSGPTASESSTDTPPSSPTESESPSAP